MESKIELVLCSDKDLTLEVAKTSIENKEYGSLADVIKAIYNALYPYEAEPKDDIPDYLIEKGLIGFRVTAIPISIEDKSNLRALVFALKFKHHLH